MAARTAAAFKSRARPPPPLSPQWAKARETIEGLDPARRAQRPPSRHGSRSTALGEYMCHPHSPYSGPLPAPPPSSPKFPPRWSAHCTQVGVFRNPSGVGLRQSARGTRMLSL
eukprot:scaffold888_cov569-Prasinococcus_capsulatus_cf.AAC.18